MKYLLKIKRKKDETANVVIGELFGYREFDDIMLLINYIFKNSMYIEDFSVRELRDMETSDCDPNNEKIVISGTNSCGIFN